MTQPNQDPSLADLEQSHRWETAVQGVQVNADARNAEALRVTTYNRITSLGRDAAALLIDRGVGCNIELTRPETTVVRKKEGWFRGQKTDVTDESETFPGWLLPGPGAAPGDSVPKSGQAIDKNGNMHNYSGLQLEQKDKNGRLVKPAQAAAKPVTSAMDIDALEFSAGPRSRQLTELELTQIKAGAALDDYTKRFIKVIS